jgi:cobalamin biosynthesis protein CobT
MDLHVPVPPKEPNWINLAIKHLHWSEARAQKTTVANIKDKLVESGIFDKIKPQKTKNNTNIPKKQPNTNTITANNNTATVIKTPLTTENTVQQNGCSFIKTSLKKVVLKKEKRIGNVENKSNMFNQEPMIQDNTIGKANHELKQDIFYNPPLNKETTTTKNTVTKNKKQEENKKQEKHQDQKKNEEEEKNKEQEKNEEQDKKTKEQDKKTQEQDKKTKEQKEQKKQEENKEYEKNQYQKTNNTDDLKPSAPSSDVEDSCKLEKENANLSLPYDKIVAYENTLLNEIDVYEKLNKTKNTDYLQFITQLRALFTVIVDFENFDDLQVVPMSLKLLSLWGKTNSHIIINFWNNVFLPWCKHRTILLNHRIFLISQLDATKTSGPKCYSNMVLRLQNLSGLKQLFLEQQKSFLNANSST